MIASGPRPASRCVRRGFTTRPDGSFEVPAPDAGDGDAGRHAARWALLTGHPTTWLRQHHGTTVVRVDTPGDRAGCPADAAVTVVPGAALAVVTADCAPIVLVGPRSVGIVHAGWRGLHDGVIPRTIDAMADLGDAPDAIAATLGPCISAPHYAFGAADLDAMAARFGDAVRSRDRTGAPALDMRTAVRIALTRAGVGAFDVVDECTAADGERFFSWRARRDAGRQATWVAIDP